MRNHYENLRVSRDAPPEVIKAAYRTLCHLYHPDKGYAVETMQDINASYDVLSDVDQRKAYDIWLTRFDEPDHLPRRVPEAAFEDSLSLRGRRILWSVLAAEFLCVYGYIFYQANYS